MSEQLDESMDMDDNIGPLLYIMLGRIYDVLLLVADAQGKGDEARKLIELHQKGQLMCPPPALAIENEELTDE